MIVVNVTVPGLEKVYNMNLEEKAPVSELIEEIAELIAQKEHAPLNGDIHEMILGSIDRGLQFRKDRCLRDYGITVGAELILV
ncbi:MAG: hypothetical protein LKM41_08170 [Lachnospiraceae bacterium]|jgi:hypothetical protein|nr:hypothetical protein [Lachnospiraceae bacterium]